MLVICIQQRFHCQSRKAVNNFEHLFSGKSFFDHTASLHIRNADDKSSNCLPALQYYCVIVRKTYIPSITGKLTQFYSQSGLLDMNTPLHEKWLPGQIDLGRSSFQLNVQLVLIHWPEDEGLQIHFPDRQLICDPTCQHTAIQYFKRFHLILFRSVFFQRGQLLPLPADDEATQEHYPVQRK